ncbi:unnamed protein product, partial [Rotaria sp. Silwood1]
MIRSLKDGQQNSENSAVQDKNGKLLISSRDKLDRRKECFYELLNVKSIIDSNVSYHISTLSIPTTKRDRQDKPLTLEELDQALKRMKSRKGRDNDDISADKFKVDIQKAYDSIKKELLWKICQHYGLTKKIVRLLKLIYKNTRGK